MSSAERSSLKPTLQAHCQRNCKSWCHILVIFCVSAISCSSHSYTAHLLNHSTAQHFHPPIAHCISIDQTTISSKSSISIYHGHTSFRSSQRFTEGAHISFPQGQSSGRHDVSPLPYLRWQNYHRNQSVIDHQIVLSSLIISCPQVNLAKRPLQ